MYICIQISLFQRNVKKERIFIFADSILIYKTDSMEKLNIHSCFKIVVKNLGLFFFFFFFHSSCIAPELMGIINVNQFGKHFFYFHNGERQRYVWSCVLMSGEAN